VTRQGVQGFETIFFDLDGTLWDNVECSRRILDVVMPQIVEHVPEKDPEKIITAFNAVFIEMVKDYGIYSRRCLSKVERLDRLLRYYRVGDPALSQQLGNKYGAARRMYMRNFLAEDTTSVLTELRRRGFSLGIITNGVPAIQRQTIEGLGLAPFFDHVIISGLVGYQKPDRRIFQKAMEEAGASPENTLYLGDSPAIDVGGAKKAGIKSVWLSNSRHVLKSYMPQPDYVVQKLSEILAIVGREPAGTRR